MRFAFFPTCLFAVCIFSCQAPSPKSNDKLTVKDSVIGPVIPIDTTGTGPSLSKKEDSILIANAPESTIVKRVEVWQYDNRKSEKGILTLSQTFYGGGARTDSVFGNFPNGYHLTDVNKYNSKGLLVKANYILPNSRATPIISKYDSHNNLLEETSYYEDPPGKFFVEQEKHCVNEYDAKGHLIRKREYIFNKELSGDHAYEYDSVGNCLHDTGYDMCIYHKVCTGVRYEYDSKNRITKRTSWCDAGGSTQDTYSYNDKEHTTREYHSEAAGSSYHDTRFYYDKKGNVVVEEKTSQGDSTVSYVKYKWIYYTK
jgi:hypothetical protein